MKTQDKETYWSRFADDFEERNNYVVGKTDLNSTRDKLLEQKDLNRTLELGCGNGTFSKILALNAKEFYATDFSDEMVESSKFRLKEIVNVIVQKENCFSTSFENDSFDTVFMANLLHIIPEPEKSIEESKRILKKGGQLLITSYTTEGMSFVNTLRMFYRYMKTYGKPSPTAKMLKVSQAIEMLEKYGFQIIEGVLIGKKVKSIFVKATKV